jgi:hypothetical protein
MQPSHPHSPRRRTTSPLAHRRGAGESVIR